MCPALDYSVPPAPRLGHDRLPNVDKPRSGHDQVLAGGLWLGLPLNTDNHLRRVRRGGLPRPAQRQKADKGFMEKLGTGRFNRDGTGKCRCNRISGRLGVVCCRVDNRKRGASVLVRDVETMSDAAA